MQEYEAPNKLVEDEHYSDALHIPKKPEYHKAHSQYKEICGLKCSALRVSARRIKHTKLWEKHFIEHKWRQ